MVHRKNIPACGDKFRDSMVGKNNPIWKGNEVGRVALHEWIRNRKPKPEFCESCKKFLAQPVSIPRYGNPRNGFDGYLADFGLEFPEARRHDTRKKNIFALGQGPSRDDALGLEGT